MSPHFQKKTLFVSMSNKMKNYWSCKGLIILAFSISLLFCIAFQLTSCILLSKQITATSQDCLAQFKAVSDEQNERITQLELQNKNQDNGIRFLKTEFSEYRNQIGQLNKNGNVVKYEPFSASSEKENGVFNADHQLHVIRQKKQRPARLLPLQLITGSEEQEIFTRPPTSCKDLNAVGHTLNGIYLIRKHNNSISKIIDVVFCDFKPQTRSSIIVTENRLGYLNMNASSYFGVYFYVQRHGHMPNVENGVIRYNKERLNVGKAMDISTGVFTAPKTGIYHFSFTIMKEGFSLDVMVIYFRVNGNKIGASSIGHTVAGAPATLHPTLKLKKGDRVDLWKDNQHGTLEYRSGEISHHFSGWLLAEEDLLK